MPKALIYDCFSGISGDMHIGAMLDLGVPEDLLRSELTKLGLGDEFTLQVQRGQKMGITGTRAHVALAPTAARPHRHLGDIVALIERAHYSAAVHDKAVNIFTHLAEAEAKIHNTTVDAVHFHEVGATDSIVDIVAAAVCLDYLDATAVGCASLEVGGGMVRCDHGLMPVPAPATAELLTGIPWRHGGVDQEATTPTGAAILKHALTQTGVPQDFVSQQVGYGLGYKDFAIPNVLRVFLGTVAGVADYEMATNHQVECNIDDMNPEAFAPLLDTLLAHGAMDVFMTPIVMKKSRPGTKLTVLCSEDTLNTLLELVFEHSTTIGVRVSQVQKRMLKRTLHSVDTSLGTLQIKSVRLPNGRRRWKAEHDDIARLAQGHGLSYLEAAERIRREIDARQELEGER